MRASITTSGKLKTLKNVTNANWLDKLKISEASKQCHTEYIKIWQGSKRCGKAIWDWFRPPSLESIAHLLTPDQFTFPRISLGPEYASSTWLDYPRCWSWRSSHRFKPSGHRPFYLHPKRVHTFKFSWTTGDSTKRNYTIHITTHVWTRHSLTGR